MTTMRWYFRIFAVLDIISIALLFPQIWDYITHLSEVPNTLDSRLKVYGTLLTFVSLFGTTIGFFLQKKWAAILYYIQFACRIMLWVFSIGFISQLMQWFDWGQTAFDIIFRVCMIGEFIRLYFTISGQRKKELN